MKQILVLLVLAVGCAAHPKGPTIRGADLYARVADLNADGRVVVPSSKDPITVRRDQYLVDRSRDQIFVVEQVVAGCSGLDIRDDADCTLALLGDQRFTVENAPPEPKRLHGDDEDHDISAINKARITLLVAGVAMGIGAAKCDAFDGCGELLGIGAGLDGLLLLLMTTGMK